MHESSKGRLVLRYSKSGRFLGFVRDGTGRPVETAPFARRREAQKDTAGNSPAIPASSRPTKVQLSNPDTDYAADQAIDRLIASRGKGAPDRRQASPATSDAMKELARKHGYPEDHFSPENLRNADADYAGDKALATSEWANRKPAASPPPPSEGAPGTGPRQSGDLSGSSDDRLRAVISLGSQMALSEARHMLARKARQVSLTSPRKRPE
jgi:hypothetical protein